MKTILQNCIKNKNMKHLNNFITEKLKINKNSKSKQYNYHPKTRDELKELVYKLIDERGWYADLNDIDTSKINDMSYLFEYDKFNGNISKWDVSNVKDMSCMFAGSKFTGEYGDISKWDVSNVEYMKYMFSNSKFNSDISKWDVSNVENMDHIIDNCPLEKNPPKWYKK